MMQEEEDRIDALIRSMQRQRGDQEMAVSDEALHAYLTGKASAAQKSEVRQALLRSADFREALLELSAQLESLASDEAAIRFEATAAPPPPVDLGRRIKASEPTIRQRSLPDRIGAALQDIFAPMLEFLERTLQLRVLVPVGVAVTLAVSIGPRLVWSPIVAPALTTQMNPRSFATAPGLSRGRIEDHEEAARLQLRHWLRLDEGQLVFDPPHSRGDREEADQRVKIRLVGEWRHVLRVVDVPTGPILPVSGSSEKRAILWLALLPRESGDEVELRSYPVTGGSMAVRWDTKAADRGVLLVTYGLEGRIDASPCVLVDFSAR